MLQGTRLACLLPTSRILYNSRLVNFRHDTVHVLRTMPHQIKTMRNVLQEREKARVSTHHNRTAQTNKVHDLPIQTQARHHSHTKHKVSIDQLAAKVFMFKASAQTVIVSRFTSKRSTSHSRDNKLSSACLWQEFLAWVSRSLCLAWHNNHVSLIQRSKLTAHLRLIEQDKMLQR
jgi:hypothetical protein